MHAWCYGSQQHIKPSAFVRIFSLCQLRLCILLLHYTQKPNEVKLTLDIEQNRINSGHGGSGGNVVFLQSPLIISTTGTDITHIPCTDQKASSQGIVGAPVKQPLIEFCFTLLFADVQSVKFELNKLGGIC